MRRAVFLLFIGAGLALAQKQPFDAQAMMRLARISDPQLSPDGRTVAFTVQRVDLDGNTKPTHVYVVSALGGEPRQITTEGSLNQRPRWSPDSQRIALVSDRSGAQQVWLMNADGTGASASDQPLDRGGRGSVLARRGPVDLHERGLSGLR